MMSLQTLFGGAAASGWLSVAYLLVLFGIRVVKPEVIRSHTLFRWACTLFALSILLPAGVQMAMPYLELDMTAFFGRGPQRDYPMPIALLLGLGPCVLALSLFCSFASLAPPVVMERKPAAPQKHPLD